MAILKYVKAVVFSLWPRALVKLFGSFVTGLQTPFSDLDIVICLPKVRQHGVSDYRPGMLEGADPVKETWQQNLARCLRMADWVQGDSVKIIESAIPIISLSTHPGIKGLPLESQYAVQLDISFQGPSHNGLATNGLVLSLQREFPALTPLTIVVKHLLRERALHKAYTGGLSSYGLVLLVARFLQECDADLDATLPRSDGDLGNLLMALLDFYGHTFNPRATGISVARNCYLARQNVYETHAPSLRGGGGSNSSTGGGGGGDGGGGGGGTGGGSVFKPSVTWADAASESGFRGQVLSILARGRGGANRGGATSYGGYGGKTSLDDSTAARGGVQGGGGGWGGGGGSSTSVRAKSTSSATASSASSVSSATSAVSLEVSAGLTPPGKGGSGGIGGGGSGTLATSSPNATRTLSFQSSYAAGSSCSSSGNTNGIRNRNRNSSSNSTNSSTQGVTGLTGRGYVDEHLYNIQCSEIFTMRIEKLHTET
jgi:hypothetical protein